MMLERASRAMPRRQPHSRLLQSAWAEHGARTFEFAVLEAVEFREDLIAREQFWMETLNAVACGFNVCPNAGGGGQSISSPYSHRRDG